MTAHAYSARIALVGDRSPHVRSHHQAPLVLDRLREREGLDLDVYWVPTGEVDAMDAFDGIWVLPGSPYRSEAGAISAIQTARERGIPFLGTCGGFQHAMLEYARNVCGATGVQHAENTPDGDDLLIVPLACSLDGHEVAVEVRPGTLAGRLLGAERSTERYHCSYGLDPTRQSLLEEHGLVFSAYDDEGAPRVAELPEHPFFLVTLFQPELSGDGTRPHPFIQAFAHAAAGQASQHAAAGQIVETGRGAIPAPR
jgi:CTP synthase (UTP-ammonia lyase)